MCLEEGQAGRVGVGVGVGGVGGVSVGGVGRCWWSSVRVCTSLIHASACPLASCRMSNAGDRGCHPSPVPQGRWDRGEISFAHVACPVPLASSPAAPPSLSPAAAVDP